MKQHAHPIVVAVPDDHDVEVVLDYAAAEARVHRCGLRLVHALHDGDKGRAEVVLARAADTARALAGPSVTVTTRAVVGPPVAAVLSASHDAQLVVLRRRDMLHLLAFLARDTSRAVTGPSIACLPGEWSPRPADSRPVLLAVADPRISAASLRRGLEAARDHRTRLHVLHAWRLPGHSDQLIHRQVGPELVATFRTALEAELGRCRERGDFADVPVELDIQHGTAAELVVHAARDAQMLLLGRNVPARDGAIHLGRTPRAVLHESPCPTILLPSPTPVPGRSGSARDEVCAPASR
jgi:nucleotide-binding universal stress UspA family protein